MSESLVVLLAWGTLVGLDLVSVVQSMIARPLVAGTVSGLILGDPLAGATVGAILELFALDVLPVGAVRYPDYGIGTVAATATAAHAPGVLGTGIAVCVGLAIAYLGELSIRLVRHRNTMDVRRWSEELEAGDTPTIVKTQLCGVCRDTVRSLAVTVLGVLTAMGVYHWTPVTVEDTILVTVVVTGAALGAAAGGLIHAVGKGAGLRWFAVGLAAGLVWVVVS